MIVISDSTPIISLLKAGCLELLQKLYGNVVIPNAVYHELTENPVYLEEAEIIRATKYLSVVSVENVKSVNVLRSVAKQLKVKYIGTAGILMLAYDKGYIGKKDVKCCLDTMLSSNIRLDKKICNTVMIHIGMDERY